uniref:cilia- and flagella-associated protein 47-like n=1 Tax=Myxine glutinosa TaxID=7769 RepID=UPI00358EA22D
MPWKLRLSRSLESLVMKLSLWAYHFIIADRTVNEGIYPLWDYAEAYWRNICSSFFGNFLQEGPSDRWIVNFDHDLADGLVLATAIAAYCPFLIASHLCKVLSRPENPEESFHNCLVIVGAMHSIAVGLDCLVSEMMKPCPVQMLMLCVELYSKLPAYVPHCMLNFSGALHSTVSQQLCLSNPSSRTLRYEATIVGRDSGVFYLHRSANFTHARQVSSIAVGMHCVL